MTDRRVWIYTSNLAERYFLEAILSSYLEAKSVGIKDCMVESSAISTANSALLMYPGHPVALVLNAESRDEEQIEEDRATIGRIFSDARRGTWQVSYAIPSLAAWAMADPRIRAAFEGREDTRPDPGYDRSTYIAQAVRIGELVTLPDWVWAQRENKLPRTYHKDQKSFDLAALRKKFPEADELCAFIEAQSERLKAGELAGARV
jgi:hypothetical protein